MKYLLLFAMSVGALFVNAPAQGMIGPNESPVPRSVRLRSFTLTAAYAEDGHGDLKPSAKADRNCFDFVTETEVLCGGRWDIVYGGMRTGDDWDWFFVPSDGGTRSRLRPLGPKKWSDIRTVPEVEPLPKLAPGEKRAARIVTSGSDGALGRVGSDGVNGINGDGSVRPEKNKPNEVPAVATPDRIKGTPAPDLFVKAVKGEMYVLRVVDDKQDFYVLMRVDDIVRGRKAKISWKKVKTT